MPSWSGERAIVVGVDGSAESDAALVQVHTTHTRAGGWSARARRKGTAS